VSTSLQTKTIYIIRHGETEYNRMGIVQGSGVDADLNELGRLQAAAFHEAYRAVPFQRIYTSALRRTVQSVQAFIEDGVPYERHAGLNEICWGTKEGKIPDYRDDEYYRSLIFNWRSGNVTMPTDQGESPMDVKLRQLPVLDLILSRPEEETVLVAMHGRAMRVLLTTLFEEPLSQMDHWEHTNLCLYKVRYTYETSRFTLEVANDIRHLAGIVVHPDQTPS
jgi:broad specificity phosphatase PhoE